MFGHITTFSSVT